MSCPASLVQGSLDESFSLRVFYTKGDVLCSGAGGTGCSWTEDISILQSRGPVGGWAQLSHRSIPHSAACGKEVVSFNTWGPYTAGQTYRCIYTIKDGTGATLFTDTHDVEF